MAMKMAIGLLGLHSDSLIIGPRTLLKGFVFLIRASPGYLGSLRAGV